MIAEHIFELVIRPEDSWRFGYKCSCGRVSRRHRTEQGARSAHKIHISLLKSGIRPIVDEHW